MLRGRDDLWQLLMARLYAQPEVQGAETFMELQRPKTSPATRDSTPALATPPA